MSLNSQTSITIRYFKNVFCLHFRQIDVKHEFLDQVRDDYRKVLCVIVGVAKTATDGQIHVHTDIKGEEKIDTQGVCNLISLYKMI